MSFHVNMTSKETKKIRIYTRTGDKGSASLYNLKRHSKSEKVFEALGDLDELNSQIGLAIEYCIKADNGLQIYLTEVQSCLFDIGSQVATPLSESSSEQIERVGFENPESHIKKLENWIDTLDETLPPLRNFILPSGGLSSTHLHVARSIARRAERHVVPLVQKGDCPPVALQYLNRLSDFLFICARFASFHEQQKDTIYKKASISPSSLSTSATNSSSLSSSRIFIKSLALVSTIFLLYKKFK